MPSGFKTVAEGIMKKGDAYFERVQVDGKDTTRKIPVFTLKEAKEYRAGRLNQHAQSREGIWKVESPYARRKAKVDSADIGKVLDAYIEAGCPQADWSPRKPGIATIHEHGKVAILRKWHGWREQAVEEIRVSHLLRYADWRRKNSKRIKNGRRIDMEMQTLNLAVRYAHSRDLISSNPFAQMEYGTFQNGAVNHCKHLRPENAEQLHALAGWMASHDAQGLKKSLPRGTALCFQMLFEAFTGVRTNEALRCRWDAKYGEAGFIDGDYLHLARSKDGINPWAEIKPHLRELLRVMKLWRDTCYPKSPWFFPSPTEEGKEPVGPTALVHALNDAAADLCPALKFTSHGMRAYYATARRSEFVPDALIAAEMGDKTGAAIVIQNYGALPPNWRNSKEGKITWLPTGKVPPPAWTVVMEMLKKKGRLADNVISIAEAVG